MKLSKSGEKIDLTTETTLLAKKAIDLSIVENWEPHSTTTAVSQDAIPAILTAQNKKIPWGTQQEHPPLEQSQQHRPLSTNQIPGGTQQETPFQQHSNNTGAQKSCPNYKPNPPPPPSTPPNPYPGEPLPPGTEWNGQEFNRNRNPPVSTNNTHQDD